MSISLSPHIVKDVTHLNLLNFPLFNMLILYQSLYLIELLPHIVSSYISIFFLTFEHIIIPTHSEICYTLKCVEFRIVQPAYNIVIVIFSIIASSQRFLMHLYFINELCSYQYPHTCLKKFPIVQPAYNISFLISYRIASSHRILMHLYFILELCTYYYPQT